MAQFTGNLCHDHNIMVVFIDDGVTDDNFGPKLQKNPSLHANLSRRPRPWTIPPHLDQSRLLKDVLGGMFGGSGDHNVFPNDRFQLETEL